MILAESPRRQRVTQMVNWGHWFALSNILIALLISSVYLFSSPAPGSALGSAYMIANWLGHISFITFFGFVIFILPMCYFVSSSKAIKGTASVVAAIGLAFLGFDALLYTQTGFHISFQSAEFMRDEAQYRIAQFSWTQWTYLVLLFVIWLGCQLVLANAIWQRLNRLVEHHIGLPVTSVFVACFMASHAIHIWADAALYQPVIKQDNLFPLSYPATAKTTMSRYGLLDLERYQQRRDLQFSSEVTDVTYPTDAIYCRVDNTQSTLVFVQSDNVEFDWVSPIPFNRVDGYFTTTTSPESMVTSTVFGVPELYHSTLKDKRPVLLALLQAQGLDVAVSYPSPLPHAQISAYQRSFAALERGLHIAFAPAADIIKILNSLDFEQHRVLIAAGGKRRDESGQLIAGQMLSNLPLQASLASVEDIAPTIMRSLGCGSPVRHYSTGRDLVEPERQWLVTTSADKIMVFNQQQRIDVMSNGSYDIINLDDNTRSTENLNMDLLSQAFKHLTRFSNNR